MKKVCVSAMVICLTATGLFASPSLGAGDYGFNKFTAEEVANLREDFKDAEKLERFLNNLLGTEYDYETPPLFKQKFDVEDSVMQAALMIMIRRTSAIVGWGTQPRYSYTREEMYLRNIQNRLFQAIMWLSCCADAEAKRFLMDIATDGTKWESYRREAIGAYLFRADAQETRDALARFLIGDMRIAPYDTYLQVMMAYDAVEDDPQKCEAIVVSLIVALARESDKWTFVEIDEKLAKRSKEYAESSQRLAMVQRISNLPPSPQSRNPDMKAVLESFQSLTKLTSVSTNLTELMARDFRKPD